MSFIQTVNAKVSQCPAALVTVENIQEVSKWVGGFVLSQEMIDFLGGDDKYHRVNVGEWVVMIDPDARVFKEFTADHFNALFEIPAEESSAKPASEEMKAGVGSTVSEHEEKS